MTARSIASHRHHALVCGNAIDKKQSSLLFVGIAQLVERGTHKPKVTGSIPVADTIKSLKFRDFMYNVFMRSYPSKQGLAGRGSYWLPARTIFDWAGSAKSMYTVYVLQDEKGKLYKGFTNNLARRFSEHKRGKSKTTSKMNNLTVVYKEEFKTFDEARAREVYFKTSAGRRFLKTVMRS